MAITPLMNPCATAIGWRFVWKLPVGSEPVTRSTLPKARSSLSVPIVTDCVEMTCDFAYATPTAASPQVLASASVLAVASVYVPIPMLPVLVNSPRLPTTTSLVAMTVRSASTPAPVRAPPACRSSESLTFAFVEATT